MRVVLWFFALVGFVVTLFVALGVAAALHYRPMPAVIAGNTILTIDLAHPVTEALKAPLFERFVADQTVSFPSVLTALRRATNDSRIKGLVVRIGTDSSLGLGQSQELRAAVAEFRAKGKFALAYSDSYGEFAGGTRPYYLASGFDEIWLQPSGMVALTGIGAEIPFFKGAFDKLGISAEFERRGEFKTAATQFTETKLPDTDRAAMTDLIGSLYGQITEGIGQGRQVPADQVRELIDDGPYPADVALTKHLVDHLGYRDEVEAAAQKRAGADAKMMNFTDYDSASGINEAAAASDVIGVVRAVGMITSGDQDSSPLGQDAIVAADKTVQAFHDAVADGHVKAIVLRIESPGGSETASESIWHAVSQARQAGKPVIVSMANVAASGGYYIAAAADKIVAEPMTETGSIGVFAGKFVVSDFLDKLGINHDTVSLGKNALIGDEFTPLNPDQRRRFADLVDTAYQTFISRVALGRHMDPTQVDAVARGRVWTGVEAKDKGLVDVLGGFDAAVGLAKEAAHLPVDKPVLLRNFPAPKSVLQTVLAGASKGAETSERLGALSSRLSALDGLLERLGITAGGGPTVMPRVTIDE